MARNPSISLTDHQQEFVRTLVDSGRYHGVSEVVRAGLRLLEDEEERRDVERGRLRAGLHTSSPKGRQNDQAANASDN